MRPGRDPLVWSPSAREPRKELLGSHGQSAEARDGRDLGADPGC